VASIFSGNNRITSQEIQNNHTKKKKKYKTTNRFVLNFNFYQLFNKQT
jgi:hypothetical protein